MGEKGKVLVLSSTPGCYALGNEHDPALTSGDNIEILLGGRWLRGRVEYSNSSAKGCYAHADATGDPSFVYGYYIVLATGETCGLCTGMTARFARVPGSTTRSKRK